MDAPALSHHDLLALVAPFTARGWRVDLEGSARQEGRVAFVPRTDDTAVPAIESRLVLEVLGPRRHRLVRSARRVAEGEDCGGDRGEAPGHDHGGAEATLVAQGADVAALLAAVEAVPPARQFVDGEGFVVAGRHEVSARGGPPVLLRGEARVGGFVLTLALPRSPRAAAEIALVPKAMVPTPLVPTAAPRPTTPAPPVPRLPQDLLAVLGWNWTRLVPGATPQRGWTTRLRLRAAEPARTQRAEAALVQAAAHLARTLAEPPARFHERHRGARWGAFFRRGIPTFTAIGLVALALGSTQLQLQLPTHVWVALYHVPTLIVAAAFLLQELPRFEIPPVPRRDSAPRW
jgi:hypothetical protein